ncbi:MAG: PKD domain-containing protein [Ectothiorhodospiraceae bacterium]|nr:PKD domain-containing protein [Ectothiorhodospiraceae bacterium]
MNGTNGRFEGQPYQLRLLWLVLVMGLLFTATSAHASWWNPRFDVTIETATNGMDADSPTGPEILLGAPIIWTYTITNTGRKTLHKVDVFDRMPNPDGGWFRQHTEVCTIRNLKKGESQSCTLEGTAKQGQFKNTGIALAYGKRWWQFDRDTDNSHYLGTLGNPAIDLEKTTQGQDADAAPGPELNVGEAVNWVLTVTNTGDVDLSNIVVTDEQVLPVTTAATIVCEIVTLSVGQSQTCNASGIAIEGQYQNLGKASAQGLGDSVVSDQDASHYTGMVGNALSSLPTAVPTRGDAPLTVTFTPNASTNNAISRYEWDFEGDGTYDRSETVGRDQRFTYNTPGNYNATLRVTDSEGEQATGIVVISVNNESPQVSVTLNPSNGQIPLTVNFAATATDSDGIAQFEWDYDGDGTFDETTTTGTAANTYSTEGAFQARVRVTDNLGVETTLTIPTLEVNALAVGSPTVALSASPVQGNSPLAVTLSATATDPDGGTIEQYEWDTDGDGTYDQTTTTATLQTTYNGIGTFYPRVRVTDSDSQQAEDVAQVFVEPQLNLSVSIDTIDPSNSETAMVSTTLGGDTEVSVVIEDRNAQQVRTLVPFGTRTAGSYDDTWDGTNDAGEIVSEGDYRVILLYRLDGVVERLDLALTTGGVQRNPPRSRIPSSFSPLAGDPLDITFTLNRASEVTAFMGLFNVNTRLITFMQRQPLGRGAHIVTWNGENSEGQLIDAGNDRFLFGIFAYTLPDNAIYVRSGVHVSSVIATPSIFQPTQLTPDGSPSVSNINVELNRAGDVKLTINDTESGATVAEFDYTGQAEGTNTITWDGRDNDGNYVAAGTYRLGISGVDSTGYQSLTVYALQRVFY